MKRKIFLPILTLAVIALIVYAKSKPDKFSLAEDFPQGALIYAQTSDLPALVKLWNESGFKEKYLASQNYDEFKNRHLARKIESRWDEFNEATGFPVDLETVAALATDKAAIAVYDIGKLDFVFIAPISNEVFAATRFVQNSSNYAEQTLDDGTIIYRMKIEADSGRQKQELIFTNVKNCLILATSEKLLAATLNNINGKSTQNNLAAAPEFSLLRDKIEPHAATVWINQSALNDDYFKRYWLMSDISELKNYRAGIFDFDAGEKGKLIERRKFLLVKSVETKSLTDSQANEMLSFLPEKIPFYQLESADNANVSAAIKDTLFERAPKSKKTSSQSHRFADYEMDGGDFSGNNDYTSPGDNFDQSIDETDEQQIVEERNLNLDFTELLQAAKPAAVLTFTDPKILPFPLFAEFRRAAVIQLSAPQNFDKEAFESKISNAMAAKILVATSDTKLAWETKNENNFSWRELNLPMLGQTISYTLLHENELVVTNDAKFLGEILAADATKKDEKFSSAVPFSELTFIDITQKEKSYHRIFAELQEKPDKKDFFTGNIASFLDSMSEIRAVEIRKSYTSDTFDEELILSR